MFSLLLFMSIKIDLIYWVSYLPLKSNPSSVSGSKQLLQSIDHNVTVAPKPFQMQKVCPVISQKIDGFFSTIVLLSVKLHVKTERMQWWFVAVVVAEGQAYIYSLLINVIKQFI